jgi:hypothetical protein
MVSFMGQLSPQKNKNGIGRTELSLIMHRRLTPVLRKTINDRGKLPVRSCIRREISIFDGIPIIIKRLMISKSKERIHKGFDISNSDLLQNWNTLLFSLAVDRELPLHCIKLDHTERP